MPINKDRKSPIFATSTSNKGNFSLFGRAISQDNDDGPEYAQLSATVNENLRTTNGEFSAGRVGSIPGILHELLQKGDAAVKYMQGSRNMKINNWILLDNYVQGRAFYSSFQTRVLRIHSKRSKKHMSMKQHRDHCLFLKSCIRFDSFKPMHLMWKDYIALLLRSTGCGGKLTHFTGIGGIMICETAEAFGIVTEENKFRVIPKKGSVFVFQVDCWKVTLHGDKLDSRKVGI